MKDRVWFKILDYTSNVVLIADIAMLEPEVALIFQPSQVFSRTITIEIVKDDQLVASAQGI